VTTTDVLILVGVLVFMLLGFRDGFFKKIFGILGFLGGLICAIKFMVPFSNIIMHNLEFSEESALILAFFMIFIMVIIIVNLIYRWFGQSGSETMKIWSRIAGAFLGVAQGLVSVSLILMMLNLFGVPSEDEKQESLLYEDSYQIAPIVFDYSTKWMPASKKFFEELKGKIENVKSSH